MTNPEFTYIQAIIDRSGSMATIVNDAKAGFDAFIAEQCRQPGTCCVSLVQFDDRYEVVYADRPIDTVPPLTLQPRGSTSMLDAVGRSINELGQRLAAMAESERPSVVLVCIVTDGMENTSREFTHQAIKQMIEHQEKVYNWTFLYMGADQDAIEQGSKMGIDEGRALTYERGNAQQAYAAMSASVRRMRFAVNEGIGFDEVRAAGVYTEAERRAAGES